MKKRGINDFALKMMRLYSAKKQFPVNGQIELTYRCNLACVHCYCEGFDSSVPELTTAELKIILDQMRKEGCLYLCLTGGEPLIRNDFMDIYLYAKRKGFIITLFSNATLLNKDVAKKLEKSPPCSIEITLNGITQETYERITQVSGSFKQALANIIDLVKRNLPVVLKTNCLKQNFQEIAGIKSFADKLLGRRQGRGKFIYDTMIYPRLNGDQTPCRYRLSSQELLQMRKNDPDIWKEYKKMFCLGFSDLKRDKKYLYHCDTWRNSFFITPYGKLRFCQFSSKFESDLRYYSLREGFYNSFPRVLNEEFKSDSKCKECRFRPACYYCPARAFLETGNEESPVEYFCHLANGSSWQSSN